jgi:PTS system ascorbate-specific IIB component
MKRLKIVAICGHGMGTAILMKMLIQKCAKKLGVDADVDVGNVAVAKSYSMDYDMIVASTELEDTLKAVGLPFILLDNFIKEEPCLDKMKKVLSENFDYKL